MNTNPARFVSETPSRSSTGSGTAVALHIDWTRCEGRALCVELLPELLDRDEWGYPEPRGGAARGSILVSPDLLDNARDATRLCPVLALRLLRS